MILKTILYSPIKHDQVLRTALFWVITQRLAVIFLPTFRGRPIGLIFRGQDSLRNPEKRSCHLSRGESLKPHNQVYASITTRFGLKRQSSGQYYKNV